MLFCSSESYEGAASASCNSSGEFDPCPPKIEECPSAECASPTGKCVVTNQNPPTSKRTRIKGRIFMALRENLPDIRTASARRSSIANLRLPDPILETNSPEICCVRQSSAAKGLRLQLSAAQDRHCFLADNRRAPPSPHHSSECQDGAGHRLQRSSIVVFGIETAHVPGNLQLIWRDHHNHAIEAPPPIRQCALLLAARRASRSTSKISADSTTAIAAGSRLNTSSIQRRCASITAG